MSGIPTIEPLPGDVRCARDYAAHARARWSEQAWAYFEDVAGDGLTRQSNRAAWDQLAFVPRVLRGAASADTRIELLGRTWPSPLLVAPMALQQLAHPDGELGTALAAAAQGTGMVLAMQSSVALETIAAAMRDDRGRGPLWFQLYVLQDRGATLDLVRRAEHAGYEALVLTVDAAIRAARPLALPSHIRAVHLQEGASFDPSVSWDDVAWLQSRTQLPVLLKGVLHSEDARQAARMQLAGVIVSNHGGRVLDGAAATAPALRRIADAIGGELPLLVDGGIASGADVLKALALGAHAVLAGRPVLHGLGAAGVAGAAHVLRLLRDELQLALAQCGLASAQAIPGDLLLG